VTAGVAGQFLDPFSPARLMQVTGTVSLLAIVITLLAVRGLEGDQTVTAQRTERTPLVFREALAEVWTELAARRFTLFVFISMLAYSLQDLILEPFAGFAFGMTPGESTALAGTQHGGVLAGMIAVAASGSLMRQRSRAMLRYWIIGGCIASGLALLGIAWGGLHPQQWHLSGNVFLLGFANGAFAVAAIATMMVLASQGSGGREGLRMGLWGAAQAIAFAIGGFLGTVAADLARQWLPDPPMAYGLVFTCEAVLFFVSAELAAMIPVSGDTQQTRAAPSFGDVALQEVMDGGVR
jgi:BCD family chlorophyll transporter-like MFS transporter